MTTKDTIRNQERRALKLQSDVTGYTPKQLLQIRRDGRAELTLDRRAYRQMASDERDAHDNL